MAERCDQLRLAHTKLRDVLLVMPALVAGIYVFCLSEQIGIGESLAAPPLPHHRTYGSRIRRFGELSDTAGYHQGGEAERSEEVIRQGELERFAIAEPPWASWAAGGFRRHGRADTAVSQLAKASASMLPLLPGDGSQPSPDPLVECAQHRRRFAEAKVGTPSD